MMSLFSNLSWQRKLLSISVIITLTILSACRLNPNQDGGQDAVNRLCPLTEGLPASAATARNYPSTLELAGDDEPGQRLMVTGQVFVDDCDTPLPDATIIVWQANDVGVYENHLTGTMMSDEDGRYELHTILPGNYGDEDEMRSAHIHFKVGHPDTIGFEGELFFEDDPYLQTDPLVVPSLVQSLTSKQDAAGTYWYTEFDVVIQSLQAWEEENFGEGSNTKNVLQAG